MATVALESEQARSAAINAAKALQGDRIKRERSISAAKYTIGRAGTLVAEEAIQLHGGMGMTWELPVSHFAKRLTMIGHQLGAEDHHLARFIKLGQAVCDLRSLSSTRTPKPLSGGSVEHPRRRDLRPGYGHSDTHVLFSRTAGWHTQPT